MTLLAITVREVLSATEEVLSASDRVISSTSSSVRSLLAAGEDVVAYEILCDNLYEIGACPPASLVDAMRRAVIEVGADPARADMLMPD